MGKVYKFKKSYVQQEHGHWAAQELLIENIPAQEGRLVYNQAEQFPVWRGLDLNKLDISGEISAVDAGIHYVTFTPKENFFWSNRTRQPIQVPWYIDRQPIEIYPTLKNNLTYNAQTQSPEWNNFDTVKMTLGGVTSALPAGTYTATFTPTSNYCWSDNSFEPLEIDWIMQVLHLTKPTATAAQIEYSGTEQTLGLNSYLTQFMTVEGNKGTELGDYTATLSLVDKVNTCWADGSTDDFDIAWSIIPKKIATVTVPATVNPGTTVTVSDTQYYTVSGNGINASVPGDYSITFTLRDTVHYRWTDGTTAPKTINFTIKRRTVSMPTWTSNYTFTGNSISPNYTFDSSILAISGDTSAVNVGNYTFKVDIVDKVWYEWADTHNQNQRSGSWSIVKMKVAKPVLDTAHGTTFDYDGEVKYLKWYYLTDKPVTVTNNGRTEVGEQTVTISLNDKNNMQWTEDGTTADLTWTLKVQSSDPVDMYFCTYFKDSSGATQSRTINATGTLIDWSDQYVQASQSTKRKRKSIYHLPSSAAGLVGELWVCIGWNDSSVTYESASYDDTDNASAQYSTTLSNCHPTSDIAAMDNKWGYHITYKKTASSAGTVTVTFKKGEWEYILHLSFD